jgi:hypothetical protein
MAVDVARVALGQPPAGRRLTVRGESTTDEGHALTTTGPTENQPGSRNARHDRRRRGTVVFTIEVPKPRPF